MSNDDQVPLSLITGPMFAGKSTELCSRFQRLSLRDKSIIIAPSMSKDHDAGAICPREQSQRHPATFRDKLTPKYALQLVNESYTNVFIDEAQFFSKADELTIFCKTLIDANVHVYVAALNLDHKKRPWPAIAHLESQLSPVIEILYARCSPPCQNPAIYSAKMSASSAADVIVDVLAEYKPLCRSCYLKNNQKATVVEIRC